jgi:hypothetical protein
MSLLNSDELSASRKFTFQMGKTGGRTTVAQQPFSVFEVAGVPGAGVLAIGNTANGVSHTKATAGYPTFSDAPAGKGWYLGLMDGSSNIGCQRDLYDFIYSCGAYAFNANQALTAQPSIDDRIRTDPPHVVNTAYRAGDIVTSGSAPIKAYRCTVGGITGAASAPNTTGVAIADGTVTWTYIGNGLNYAQLEIFIEQVTAATGNQAVTVTYSTMGADGVTLTAGRSTGATGIGGAPTLGRMWKLPLQAGDKNIALLTNILGTVATVGTFNVHIARRITGHSAFVAPFVDTRGWDRLGLPYIPNNAALREVMISNSTAIPVTPLYYTLYQG